MSRIIDPAGFVAIAGTFLLVMRSKQFSTDRVLRRIVVCAVLARTAYSMANVLVGPIFGLSQDAQGFHAEAARFASGQGISVGLVNGWVYSAGVGALYRLTGGGLLLGQQLSIVAVVLTAASMMRILNVLGVRRARRRWVIAVVMFLPTGIVYTSGTLREAFQQLFFVLTVEYALELLRRTRLRTLIRLSITVVLGAALHGALAVASVAVAAGAVVLASVLRSDGRARISLLPRQTLLIALVAALTVGLTASAVLFPYQLQGGALSAATSYRERTPPARADYLRLGPEEEISLRNLPLVFGWYEIAPTPAQVTEVVDLVALAEAMSRMVLLALALLALVHATRASALRFAHLLLIVGGWFTLELAWSLGTTNWGTGARHHLVAYPLLAIAAAACPRASPVTEAPGVPSLGHDAVVLSPSGASIPAGKAKKSRGSTP